MLGKHVYDPSFIFSSKALKKVLASLARNQYTVCLDMPCGNGRNIFLLSSYFENVTGFDMNQAYLEEIHSALDNYRRRGAIAVEKADLLYETPLKVREADFICNIHYYNYSLISRLIDEMKNDAFLYIETPGCSGDNFLELPIESEIHFLLRDVDVLSYDAKHCKSLNLDKKGISFKALIRKK